MSALGSTTSYAFDNTVSYQTAQTDAFSAGLATTDAYTVMFWFRGDDLLQEDNNTRLITVRHRPEGGSAADPAFQVEGFGQGFPDDLDLRLSDPLAGLWFSPDAPGVLGDDGDPENAVWHHVAFVVSNQGSPVNDFAYAETFVDGQSQGYSEFPDSTDNPLGNTEGELILGGHDVASRSATGFLDDFALFDGVVPAQIIAEIASGLTSPGDLDASVVFRSSFASGDLTDWTD